MVNIVQLMKQFFSFATVGTRKTPNGTAYCHITNPHPEKIDHELRPLGFAVSNEHSFYELIVIARALQHLSTLTPVLPEVRIFSAENSKRLARQTYIDHIYRNPYEMSGFACVAPWLVAHSFNQITMQGVHMPFMYAHVQDAQKLGIRPNSWTAGIESNVQDYRRQIETIKQLKPNLRRALIPHDGSLPHYFFQGTNFEYGNMGALARECERQNIEVVPVGVAPSSNIGRDLRAYNPEQTMFVINREPTVMTQMSEIITACNQLGMTAFSDLPLPTLHGAAFGSGDSGLSVIKPFAQLLNTVCVERVLPRNTTTPIITESDRLLFNKDSFATQGVQVDTQTLNLLEAQNIMVVADNPDYIL